MTHNYVEINVPAHCYKTLILASVLLRRYKKLPQIKVIKDSAELECADFEYYMLSSIQSFQNSEHLINNLADEF